MWREGMLTTCSTICAVKLTRFWCVSEGRERPMVLGVRPNPALPVDEAGAPEEAADALTDAQGPW